jgi:hypothetical protein
MREERFQRIYLLTQAIIALGTIGIAVSICISIYSFKEAQEATRQAQEANRLVQESDYQLHDWYRRSYTVDMIRDFEGHVVGYRETLQDAFRGLFLKDQHGVLEAGTAKNLWAGKSEPNSKYDFMKDEKKVKRVKNQLIGLLNYMEYLSQAYNESVVDQKVFEESLSKPMIYYYDFLEEFIKESQKQLGYDNWQPFSDVVVLLKAKQRENVASPKPPTGPQK